MILTVSLITIFLFQISAFTFIQSGISRSHTTTLWGIRCEDKFYQLEEREDQECSTTELYLQLNRNVDFGDTDGPKPIEVEGQWQVEPGTDNFSMTVRRKFSSGQEGTDMGEFQFEILREYRGEMTMVGESVAITGIMLNKDEIFGDKEVGFFNMIDGTKERESYALEGRFKFEIDETKGLRLSELAAVSGRSNESQDLNIIGDFGNWQPGIAGPGGYDPMEVFQALPPAMADAFRNRNSAQLSAALAGMDREEAEYYMQGCIDGGLWIQQQATQQQQQLGPGGLDPYEVLETLPPAMAEAFRKQDLELLNRVVSQMDRSEVEYHIKRCEAAGLWG